MTDADRNVILRGVKIRLFPSERQAALMDRWRHQCINLSNLLLELETFAYSGDYDRIELGWRNIWETVVHERYRKALDEYRHGRRKKDGSLCLKKDGTIRKPAGQGETPAFWRQKEGLPLPRTQLSQLLKFLKIRLRETECDHTYAITLEWLKENNVSADVVPAWLQANGAPCDCQAVNQEPTPPSAELLAKIRYRPPSGLPLTQSLLQQLSRFIKAKLKDTKCIHTLDLSQKWLNKNAASQSDTVVAWLQANGATCDCTAAAAIDEKCPEQRLFIWEGELQMIMARLKAVPLTMWIGELPSHAAQATVKTLIRALETMINERRKAVDGNASRKTGFPRRKKHYYGTGSVYFPNTTIGFDLRANGAWKTTECAKKKFTRVRIHFPNGCGQMECEFPADIRQQLKPSKPGLILGTTLGMREGRIWRQGEHWYFSAIWAIPKPALLPKTGRMAGVKIAASIAFTTCDNRGQTKEYVMPPPDAKLARVHRVAERRKAVILEEQKKKRKKLEARKKWQRARKGGDEDTPQPLSRARVRRSREYYKTCHRLARHEARENTHRNQWLHAITNKIVSEFDAISIQKMDVKSLMEKKRETRHARRLARRERNEAAERQHYLKPVRKLMARAAMSRSRLMLEYKFDERRGQGSVLVAESTIPEVQQCSRCGTLNPQMKDGRRVLRCIGKLSDGTDCAAVLPRHRNAARNAQKRLQKKKEQDGAAGAVGA